MKPTHNRLELKLSKYDTVYIDTGNAISNIVF